MARWAKGQSGNPRGRIAGTKLHISRELEKIVTAGGGKISRQIAQKLTDLTLQGDTQAARLLLDRLEGRVSTAEELARRAGAREAPLAPEQHRRKLLELLRAPEMRTLIEEAVRPASESVQ